MPDSNVIDARGRFGASEQDAAEMHSQSLHQTRVRLQEADAIARDLRSVARVPEGDRPILARNLGKMVEIGTENDTFQNIRNLFQSTFEAQSDSALKKRKRFLRLSSETVPLESKEDKYHARGAEFVRLAEAWGANVKPSPNLPVDDQRRRAILNLVEGTSFDNRARASLRRTEGGRVELMERLGGLLTRIDTEVSLGSYFDLVCDRPLALEEAGYIDPDSCRDNNEKLNHLAFKSADNVRFYMYSAEVNPEGEGGDYLKGIHFLAPKVPLGFLYTSVRIKDVVHFKLSDDQKLRRHIGLKEEDRSLNDLSRGRINRIKTALVETFGSEAARIIDKKPLDADDYESWWAQWSRMADAEAKDVLWFRRPLFLTVFRERSTGRSRLALAANWYYWGADNEYAIKRLPQGKQDDDFGPWPVRDDDLYVVDISSSEGYLFWDLQVVVGDGRTEYDNRLLLIPDDNAMDLAYLPACKSLSSNLKTIFIPTFNDFQTGFSPAPHNSVGGAILRNLAYAPVGERLDDQLLRDAREKADAVQAFYKCKTEAYRRGVQRLT